MLYDFYAAAGDGRARTGDNVDSAATTSVPQGKAVMVVSAYDRIPSFKAANPDKDYGIAPLPTLTQFGRTKPSFASQAAGWAVSAGSKNPEGAVEFIKMIFNEQARLRSEMGNYYTATQYLTDKEIKVMDSLESMDYYVNLTRGVGNLSSTLSNNFTNKMFTGKAKPGGFEADYAEVDGMIKGAYNDFQNSIK